MTPRILLLTIIFFSISTDSFSAQNFLGRHGDWEAFTEKQDRQLVCSIGAEPIKKVESPNKEETKIEEKKDIPVIQKKTETKTSDKK